MALVIGRRNFQLGWDRLTKFLIWYFRLVPTKPRISMVESRTYIRSNLGVASIVEAHLSLEVHISNNYVIYIVE
jgi:hypothetical protein